MPTLRIQMPNHMELTHQLCGERITIGRQPDNTIQIPDRTVSGHHAELISEDGHYRLHDLNSTNMTFVDGEPVTDFHLHEKCKISFGTLECLFDPLAAATAEAVMTREQLERDAAFLRSENAELHAKLVAQQRRVDMLSSARLVTGRTDSTPSAAAQDALRAVSSERDDLRHTIAGLKLELGNLTEQVTVLRQEREVLRRSLDAQQMEKVGLARELKELRGSRVKPIPPMNGAQIRQAPKPGALTSRDPASALTALDPKATQKVMLPIKAAYKAVASVLTPLRGALNRVSGAPDDDVSRMELMTLATQLVDCTSGLKDHPVARAAVSVEALLHELLARPEAMDAEASSRVTQVVESLARLVEPRHGQSAKIFPKPGEPNGDEQEELMAMLVASIEVAQLQPTT